MLSLEQRAFLGDHEAAKRLTEAGVLLPCPGCGGENIVDWYRHNEVWYQCVIAAGKHEAFTLKNLRIQRKPASPGTPEPRF